MKNKMLLKDDTSEEHLEKFIDFLGDQPLMTTGRNDPCVCGSGKKYKKCCLIKDNRNSLPSEVAIESMNITFDSLTQEESMSAYPKPSEEDQELLRDLYVISQDHSELIDSEDCRYFQELRKLQNKYPENPVISNYIAAGYQILGLHERVDELTHELYMKFPDYLFAKTSLANVYLKDGFPEKAFEVLRGAYTLKQLYPQRDVFHISEVVAYAQVMVNYCCMTENLNQANIQLNLLEQILDEDDNELLRAQKTVRRARGLHNFKKAMNRLANLK